MWVFIFNTDNSTLRLYSTVILQSFFPAQEQLVFLYQRKPVLFSLSLTAGIKISLIFLPLNLRTRDITMPTHIILKIWFDPQLQERKEQANNRYFFCVSHNKISLSSHHQRENVNNCLLLLYFSHSNQKSWFKGFFIFFLPPFGHDPSGSVGVTIATPTSTIPTTTTRPSLSQF